MRAVALGGAVYTGLTALAAGLAPELVTSVLGSGLLSLVLTMTGVVLLLALLGWLSYRFAGRDRGLGLVVNLPPANLPRGEWDELWPATVRQYAGNRHDATLLLNWEVRTAPEERKRDLGYVHQAIAARLDEQAYAAHPRAPVTLYLQAKLHDAYLLATGLRRLGRPQLTMRQSRRIGSPQLTEQVPEDARSPAVYSPAYSLTAPLTDQEHRRVRRYLSEPVSHDLDVSDQDHDTVALIVCVSLTPGAVNDSVRRAREGAADSDGLTRRCHAALVIDKVGEEYLPYTPEDFALLVREIYTAWDAFLQGHPEARHHRMFLAAPLGIAFSLGLVLPPSTRIVPHEGGGGGAALPPQPGTRPGVTETDPSRGAQ